MRSPRIDPDRTTPTWRLDLAPGVTAFLQRLNTRLVMAIASVALVSLLVSSIAINQILPGYFSDQTRQRLETAAEATGILITTFATREIAQGREGVLIVPELRDSQVIIPAVEVAVPEIVAATVSVYNDQGQFVHSAAPQDVEELRAAGLEREQIAVSPLRMRIPLPDGTFAVYEIRITDPYTSRSATLTQLRSALVGAGLLALVASIILGVLAARRVTAPISRLRRAASSFAVGDFDVRATASGVREVDELAAQFNVMADRLSESVRVLQADRDRLREFVAD